MEQIIRAYGVFLLEAAVFAALMWLLFRGITDEAGHHGIFAIAGSYQEEASDMPRLDFTKYQSESEKSSPAVQYAWSGMLHVGEYSLDELLRAEDYRGEMLTLQLQGISDSIGIDRAQEIQTEDGRLRFERAGIYMLKVQAMDAWNRITVCEICIPVNGGAD